MSWNIAQAFKTLIWWEQCEQVADENFTIRCWDFGVLRCRYSYRLSQYGKFVFLLNSDNLAIFCCSRKVTNLPERLALHTNFCRLLLGIWYLCIFYYVSWVWEKAKTNWIPIWQFQRFQQKMLRKSTAGLSMLPRSALDERARASRPAV